jgi:transcriptional regulator with XRE-family HTH domain
MAERAEKQRPNNWATMLRAAVLADGRTQYAIAQAANMERSMLARFMAGESLRLATAEDLATALGFELAKKIGIPKTARKLDS